MASQPAKCITKELSATTWPDFVKLFSHKSGWNHCWCVHFHRPRGVPKEKWLRTREERGVRNRREQKALLEKDRSHGILVYLEDEPVGWCQYGPREELIRIDNSSNYRELAPENEKARLWRITCFVVDRKYRWRGVNFDKEARWGTGGGLSGCELGGRIVWQHVHPRHGNHVREAGI